MSLQSSLQSIPKPIAVPVHCGSQRYEEERYDAGLAAWGASMEGSGAERLLESSGNSMEAGDVLPVLRHEHREHLGRD